jgi:peptide-methionine (S)-S-oxide reductase
MTTPDTPPAAAGLETATLGGGCFWCLEAVYERVRGVARVESGYAGGAEPDPTYEQVCSGRTGHAEVVRVAFDPAELSYRELLEIFFTIHDPTTPDRQGADVGPQYRSIILTESDAPRRTAEAVIADLEREGIWPDPIITQVEPLTRFHPAEAYHRQYYARNAGKPYCQFVIEPKVAKFRQRFASRLRP